MVWFILKITIFAVARLFIKEIKGLNNIPKEGNYIVVANHESYIDPFLIVNITHKIIHFLTMKGRPFRYLPQNVFEKIFGVIVMEKSKKKSFKKILNFLKSGMIVGLFPGGPRSLDGNMTKGKTGAVRLALAARVPILPIGLKGTFEISPREQLIPKLKRAKINIGKPICLSKYYNKRITKSLLSELTRTMMKRIAKLADKSYLY